MAGGAWRIRHRFFVSDRELVLHSTVALDALAHQLSTVLRLPPGAFVVLLDGTGREYLAELRTVSRRHAAAYVVDLHLGAAEPAIHLTLFQCSLKQDRFEWVLQKCTELGVARFVPVLAERSVVRPAGALLKKFDRWHAVLREAAEQSGRTRLPELAEPLALVDAVAQRSGIAFVPWEEAEGMSALVDGLSDCASCPAPAHFSLLIGPEGGLTEAEVALARLSGWQVVTLGPRILRSETAAIAAVSTVMALTGQMRAAPVSTPSDQEFHV